jgi:hypothetical protein
MGLGIRAGDDRRARIAAGAVLGGVAAAALAAFYPGLGPIWSAHGAHAARLIAGHRTGWQVANWSFGVGIVSTLAGIAIMTSVLRPKPYVALALFAVAAALWIADLTFRLTVTVDAADEAGRGDPVAGWYGSLAKWGDQGLMEAAAVAAAVAVFAYAVAARGAGHFASWASWWAAAISAGLVLEVAVTGDVIPLLIYLAPAGFAIDELYRLARAQRG